MFITNKPTVLINFPTRDVCWHITIKNKDGFCLKTCEMFVYFPLMGEQITNTLL